jgi:pimeloyl-ACP methyl ester carboxylesterase
MLNVSDLGTGTPILWIHGFPLSSAIFEDQLAIEGVRHIMPDLPGFGQSRSTGGDVSIDDYAKMMIDLLDHRGIDRAVVAGLSMGGYIARLAPERLRGLILIDTRETPDDDTARAGRFSSIEKVKREGTSAVVEAMLPKMIVPEAPDALRQRVRTIMESTSPDGVTAALRAMAVRHDSSSVLRGLSVPALVVVGERDPITPPSDAQRMAAAIPHAKLVQIANAAHLSNMEHPEEFNKAVRGFVSRV